MFRQYRCLQNRAVSLATHQSRSFSRAENSTTKGSIASTLQVLKPLKGYRCIITGASRGIGRSIATTFARNGARCLLIGRDETALNSTLIECSKTSNSIHPKMGVLPFHAVKTGDVSSREFWAGLNLRELLPSKLMERSETGGETTPEQVVGLQSDYIDTSPHPSGVDILVNAAGVTHSSFLFSTSAAQIESVIQTNLMGSLWSSQILGKQMLRQKNGCIINIASLLATHGGAGSSAYVASKAGVVGLTRSLAAELGGRGVRVNCVLPGYIGSDMTDAMSSKAREEALAKIPAGRFGTVEEVADAVMFLATNQYANNCVLNLDGGLSAV